MNEIDSCVNIRPTGRGKRNKTVMNATVTFPSTTHGNKEEK